MTPDQLRDSIRARWIASGEVPGLSEDMSDREFAQALQDHFEYEQRGAWLNEQQRTDARLEYLRSLPQDTHLSTFDKAVADSRYLLDPITLRALPTLTDARFLGKYADAREGRQALNEMYLDINPWTGGGAVDPMTVGVAEATLNQAAESYDADRVNRLGHPDDRELFDRMLDPESAAGYYLNRAGIIPNAYRMTWGGELPNDGTMAESGGGWGNGYTPGAPSGSWLLPSSDAMAAAATNVSTNERHRPFTSTPVLDMPSNPTIAKSGAAQRQNLARIREDQMVREAPAARERWIQTTGFDPPDWLAFTSDVAVDMMDPQAIGGYLFPAMAGARALGRMGGSVLSNLARNWKPIAMEVGPDVAVETGFGLALTAPDQKYPSGGYAKSPEELRAANKARADAEIRDANARLHSTDPQFYKQGREMANERRMNQPPSLLHNLMGGPRN